MTSNRLHLAKELYEAFMTGDRKFYEEHLSDNFIFSSPHDVGLDKAEYFKRCWPGSGKGGNIDFTRLVESKDEVIVTYESTKSNGSKSCNTEIIGFEDDKIGSIEVFFGWDIRT